MKTAIAIIPARGGSKRIPRKNIKDFLGKPILAYSIEAALKAGCFSKVMVSTEDPEIAEVARKYGASVPFLRSAETADDFSITSDVLIEVFENYAQHGRSFDHACCIYPTAPFVSGEKLNRAYELLLSKSADSVIPVTEFSFPILRSFQLQDSSRLEFNWPEHALTRSQDLQKAYHDCGQFYFLNVPVFLNKKKLVTDNTHAIILPNLEVQDIDNEEDWQIAEMKYQFLHKGVIA